MNEVKAQCGGNVRPFTYFISVASSRISVKFDIKKLILVYVSPI